MKHWRRFVAGVSLGLAAALPAHAALFSVTEGLAGDGPQIKTYLFDITVPATYVASLADLAFLDPFDSLALGVVDKGGMTLLGRVTVDSTKPVDSFNFIASHAGSYVLLLVGDPGQSRAGSYSINVDEMAVATPVPEPGVWVMMGVGALLVGFVRLRGRLQ